MHRVPSHREVSQATRTVDLWRIANNNLADDSANIKRHAFPECAASASRCLVDPNNAIDRMKRLSTNF